MPVFYLLELNRNFWNGVTLNPENTILIKKVNKLPKYIFVQPFVLANVQKIGQNPYKIRECAIGAKQVALFKKFKIYVKNLGLGIKHTKY